MLPPTSSGPNGHREPSNVTYLDFHAPLLRVEQRPPHPLSQHVLWLLLAMVAFILAWSVLGRLDIVAVADGKLLPQTYMKIVQPAEAGIVRELHVREGDQVSEGQLLMRMDAALTTADASALEADFRRHQLAVLRIDAELADSSLDLSAQADDPLRIATEARYRANREALAASLNEERTRLERARQELAAAQQTRSKLAQVLPHYRRQEQAFDRLTKEGFSGALMASEKQRERIEREQEFATQAHIVAAAQAAVEQSQRRLTQIGSEYRRQLHMEREEAQAALARLAEERNKLAHRMTLHELRAPQDGVIQDLATHTAGTVVQPGTILATLVPEHEPLMAEVWIANDDVGFVRPGQSVKVKLAAFPFQKYGMLTGEVERVSADASERGPAGPRPGTANAPSAPSPTAYKALVRLDTQTLEMGGQHFTASIGMQAVAEIHLGDRSVAEYLLSPVTRAWYDAARER